MNDKITEKKYYDNVISIDLSNNMLKEFIFIF